MLARFINSLHLTLNMIAFKHSVFALPFALLSYLVAVDFKPNMDQFFFIILSMVTARNSAMTFNRIVDLKWDKLNPRTASRPLATGDLSLNFAKIFFIINAAGFIICASEFNQITLYASPFVLLFLCGYSLSKRFTSLTQIWLGLSLAMAPLAANLAATKSISAFTFCLAFGVWYWVVGFDLIYSCQDHDFDQKHGLKNMVTWLGIDQSLTLAKTFHALTLLFWFAAGIFNLAGTLYWIGFTLVSTLLFYEHTLIKPTDLSRVNQAFFTLNGWGALIFCVFAGLDFYL
jgi:4-hydroxybenzoate polyprenyltransferase